MADPPKGLGLAGIPATDPQYAELLHRKKLWPSLYGGNWPVVEIIQGNLALTGPGIRVETEGVGTTDSITSMSGGQDGHTYRLRPATSDRTITIVHGGVINCIGSTDIVMDNAADIVEVQYIRDLDTYTVLHVSGSIGPGGPPPTPDDTTTGTVHYDYVIDASYTGTEGATVTLRTGSTQKAYSNLDDAIDDANATRQTANQKTSFLINAGTYPTGGFVPDPPSGGSYHFYGESPESTVIQANANSVVVFNVATLTGANSQVSFHNLKISNGGFSSVICIRYGLSVRGTVDRCIIATGSSGIGLAPGNGAVGVMVWGCYFTGTGTGISASVPPDLDFFVQNNYFETTGVGIALNNMGNGFINDNVFNGCLMGIRFSGAASQSTISIVGNLFYLCDGIDFQTTTLQAGVLITGNNFWLQGDIGIDFSPLTTGQADATMISSNLFRGDNSSCAVKGDAKCVNGVVATNVFFGFDPGEEIQLWTGSGCEAFHNISTDPVTGTKQALADIGTPVGHMLGGSTGLTDHLTDAVDAHDASAVSFVPTGSIAATEVQSAIAEVASEYIAADAAHLADTVDAHDASAISVDSTTLVGVGTDVQAVLEEMDNAIALTTSYRVQFLISGGTGFVTTGIKGTIADLPAGTITKCIIESTVSGSAVVDIKKATAPAYPGTPTYASICAASKPTLSSQVAQSQSLSGWTTAIAAGDHLQFVVDSADGANVVVLTITLEVLKA